MKKYKLTEEHKKQLGPWADKWIANAMSTSAMTEDDKEICRKAVKGMYEAAGLTPPPDQRIVFVSSPFVARFAAGFAAAIWHTRKTGLGSKACAATRDATRDATRAATRAATDDATCAATDDATCAATRAATDDATCAATYDATDDATLAATRDATDAATYDATDAATYAATDAATYAATRAAKNGQTDKSKWFSFSLKGMVNLSIELKIGKFGLDCAHSAHRFLQGGNQWSAYDSFLSFFRHVSKLDIDYSKWDHWETLSLHSGPRYVHTNFCIISDRPETLTVNDRNQPHNFDGPFCQWRDGSALYSINGIRIPAWIADTKREDFTKEMILSETNVDHRRCIIQKIGIEKTIKLLGAEVVNEYNSTIGGKYELLQIDYDGRGNKRPYLKMESKSIDAIHIEGVGPNCRTSQDAIMFRNKLKKFIEPQFLS